ncbi:MAG: hypothetical protein GDA41_03755 [Rhodospirillales bacterium]|nr:hypothetical protein [Rhodospirillales bacterium]
MESSNNPGPSMLRKLSIIRGLCISEYVFMQLQAYLDEIVPRIREITKVPIEEVTHNSLKFEHRELIVVIKSMKLIPANKFNMHYLQGYLSRVEVEIQILIEEVLKSIPTLLWESSSVEDEEFNQAKEDLSNTLKSLGLIHSDEMGGLTISIEELLEGNPIRVKCIFSQPSE